MKKFFLGIHHVGDAWRFDRTFISAAQLWDRAEGGLVGTDEWVMDSGAFTEITTHGGYRFPEEDYAALIRRYSRERGLLAAVAQDYMCEEVVLKVTGLTVADHQRLTIERYDRLAACDTGGVYVMPVLQGFEPREYAEHVRMYGGRIAPGAWVGVGSVCKRQGTPRAVEAVLRAILEVRPDLRLHGFGVKVTSLSDATVASLLETADSLAWSYAARKNHGDPNSKWVARAWEARILTALGLPFGENLASFARRFDLEAEAAKDNAAAGVRRRRNQRAREEWNETALRYPSLRMPLM